MSLLVLTIKKMKIKTLALINENDLTKVVIRKPEDMIGATELLSRLNKYLDKLTEEKEKVTKPLALALKEERARFKPMETKLEEAIEQIRSEMSKYQTKMLEAKKKLEEKVAEDVASGKLDIEKAVSKLSSVAVVDEKIETTSGAVKFRPLWVAKVVDKKLVPVDFMEVDLARVKAFIQGGGTVPGCVLEEVQVVVNSR